MAQWVQALATKPELDSWDSQGAGRETQYTHDFL